MASKARVLIWLIGVMGVINIADVAEAGPRRFYDGSRGWGHWQRRSVRLGWNPGWAGYNGRWAGYGRRHAYVRIYRRGNSWPAYQSSQQLGLAENGYGSRGNGTAFGAGAVNAFGQGLGAGNTGTYGAGGASGNSYGSSGGFGGDASGSSGCGDSSGTCPDANGHGNIAPNGPVASSNALDNGMSLSKAMNYRPATYCRFCYGSGSPEDTSSPSRKGGRPSRSGPSERTLQLFALAHGP
jgi:hypothetical protein